MKKESQNNVERQREKEREREKERARRHNKNESTSPHLAQNCSPFFTLASAFTNAGPASSTGCCVLHTSARLLIAWASAWWWLGRVRLITVSASKNIGFVCSSRPVGGRNRNGRR